MLTRASLWKNEKTNCCGKHLLVTNFGVSPLRRRSSNGDVEAGCDDALEVTGSYGGSRYRDDVLNRPPHLACGFLGTMGPTPYGGYGVGCDV